MTQPIPTRIEILEKLKALRSGSISRQDASKWATEIITNDHLEVTNFTNWEVLKRIGGADLISTDRPYLYEDCDFAAWEDELRGE